MDKTLDYSKRKAVTLHASAAARCCSAFRRRLTVALGAALSFDVRYLIIPVGVASGTGNTVTASGPRPQLRGSRNSAISGPLGSAIK
jgi:hypothetical protein